MSNIVMKFWGIYILIIIFIFVGLIKKVSPAQLIRNTIAFVATILIIVLVRFIYEIAVEITVLDDIEFYVAFIGGGLTLIAHNVICNLKRIDK